MIVFRREHPIFRRPGWFQGRAIHGTDVNDIVWFVPDGKEMTEEHWKAGFGKSMGVFLNGDAIASVDARGEKITDESFYFLFNAHFEPLPFMLPEVRFGKRWKQILDTNKPKFTEDEKIFEAGGKVEVGSRSFMLLERID